MDFSLSADQALLQDALSKFLTGEYDFEHRKRSLATAEGFSLQVWGALASQGMLAIGLPAEQGGFGGAAEAAVAMELIGRHLVLEPLMSSVVVCGGLIGEFGSAAQRERILPALAAGTCRLAFAQREHGVFAARVDGSRRKLSGFNSPVLDGAVADWLIVPAQEREGAEASWFLLDAASAGVERQRYRTHDGRGGADLRLRDVAVTSDDLLGTPGQGGTIADRAAELAIPALCAEAVGIMDALIEATLGYLQSRNQFGQPIGRFQALQHRLADMFVMATQARSMSLLARERAQHPDRSVRRRALSSAKAYVGKAARFIGQNAVQLHGGMGMSAELIVSHYFKRLTLIGASFGDRAHHLGVVSDAILAETA